VYCAHFSSNYITSHCEKMKSRKSRKRDCVIRKGSEKVVEKDKRTEKSEKSKEKDLSTCWCQKLWRPHFQEGKTGLRFALEAKNNFIELYRRKKTKLIQSRLTTNSPSWQMSLNSLANSTSGTWSEALPHGHLNSQLSIGDYGEVLHLYCSSTSKPLKNCTQY
jgi:hypothetical protein